MKKRNTTRRMVTTLIGGVSLLIPVAIVLLLLGRGLELTNLLATPLSGWIPMNSVGGIAMANLVAIFLLILFCYGAGVLGRRAFARSWSESFEAKLHAIYPRYTVIKGMTQSLREDDEQFKLLAVLACFDDNMQIAYEIERGENGLVTLFLPGAPDPWSGTVVHMAEDRVKPLDVPFKEVNRSLKGLGRGTAVMLDRNGIQPWEPPAE